MRIGVSTLVPKPHTPFQWAPMEDEAMINAQIELLQRELRGPGINFSWNNAEETLVEAFLTRGDRRLSDVIAAGVGIGGQARRLGRIFQLPAWQQAFAECGLGHGLVCAPRAPAR